MEPSSAAAQLEGVVSSCHRRRHHYALLILLLLLLSHAEDGCRMAARSLYLRRSLLADSQGWEEWPQIHLLSRRRFVMLPHRKLDHSRASATAAAARTFKCFIRLTNLSCACWISRGSTQIRTRAIFFFTLLIFFAQKKEQGRKAEEGW